jgi:enoyl-CoA hydratase
MDFKATIFEVKDGIAYLKFNRPEVLNAINHDMINELSYVIDLAEKDESIKCVILTGMGKAFIAGADIDMLNRSTPKEGRDWVVFGHNLINKIEHLDKPVIAAVNGFCIGGGNEIAIACDFRIASTKAKFGQPEVNLGIIPGYGGTQRLPRLVGKGMGKYLIMTGEIVDAQEALRIGMVEKLVEPEELMTTVEKIARTIMAKAPKAIELAKRSVNYGLNMDMISSTQYEIEAYAVSFGTEDRVEGTKAFLEKRKADFKNK